MAQSRVITSDGDERIDFKSRLNDKVGGLLTLTAAPVAEPQVLLLPVGHDGMDEAELLFTLTHNPELEHSQDSAVMAVNLLKGRAAKPPNVSFQVIELAKPVPVPEFVAEIPARRKSSGVAPGFARLKDSAPEREDKEALKKEQFKQSLQDGIDRKLAEVPVISEPETQVLFVPSNYEDLSDADLHYALVNNLELKHSHDSALLTIDMVRGRVAPKGAILQTVETAASFTVQPKRVSKPPIVKARAKDVTTLQDGGGAVMLLPANYRDLSEAELGFVLTHSPELQHTPEVASFILDALFGRAEATDVKFEVMAPRIVATKSEDQPELSADRVLLIPANYRDFSATELHSLLLNTPELGHSIESASLAVQIITNAVLPPQGVKLQLSYPEGVGPTAEE